MHRGAAIAPPACRSCGDPGRAALGLAGGPVDATTLALDELGARPGGRGAVFLALRGREDGDVQVTGRWCGGGLSFQARLWLRRAVTLGALGWTAADVLPVGQPAPRRISLGGGAARATAGLIMLDDEVLGWLAVFRAPGASAARLATAWRRARDRIVASRRSTGRLPREPASLLLDASGVLTWRCHRAESWLRLPGIGPALAEWVREFLDGASRRTRSWTPFGHVEFIRLDGPGPCLALVQVEAGRALTRPIQAELSPRQLEVASLAAVGLTVDEAARAMGIGRETVRTHLKATYDRLGVATRLELGRLLDPTWPMR